MSERPVPAIRFARVGNAQPLYVAHLGDLTVSAATVAEMTIMCWVHWWVPAATVRRLCREARLRP